MIGDVAARNWLSMKTAPIKPLIDGWRKLGEGIEVVSPFELRAALMVGYRPSEVLVNGPGKAAWLAEFELPNLNVVFDSIRECEQLGGLAKKQDWLVGLRVIPSNQKDPDDPAYSGQFGIPPSHLAHAVSALAQAGVEVSVVHFHLRSNVGHLSDYEIAASDVLDAASDVGLRPRFIDCGGGLPVPGEVFRETGEPFWSDEFLRLGASLRKIVEKYPSIEQVWLENGRFLTARAGTLIVRVIDVKDHEDACYVVCDGGRITNAFPSDWERHHLSVYPSRKSDKRRYCICGPTCMAYDWIARDELELDIRVGDLIAWQNAGAYHLPWETRFSFGFAPVVWIDDQGGLSVAREREPFEKWWGVWN